MNAQIIAFPERRRSCFECVFYDEPRALCTMFDETIDSELFAAADCEAYEPNPSHPRFTPKTRNRK